MSYSETTFLNVDLDLFSGSDLQPLVSTLGRKVLPLYVGRERRRYAAHLELAGHVKNPDQAIRNFTRLVDSLPGSARKLWDGALIRDFNIGIQAGMRPLSFELFLSKTSVESVAKLGARIVFTLYAPD